MSKKVKSPEEQASHDAEVKLLRERLDLIGIQYHHAAGPAKLSKLLAQATSDEPPEVPEEQFMPADELTPFVPPVAAVETPGARAVRQRREANLLTRVIVANMNPEKREWSGEMYSVGNSVVGQVKKFVPFNNDAGWHVPQIILNHLLEKQCQIWINKKNERGETVRVGRLINELNVQILPPLTPEEMRALGQRQAMAAGANA